MRIHHFVLFDKRDLLAYFVEDLRGSPAQFLFTGGFFF